jgi:hypothetical protein
MSFAHTDAADNQEPVIVILQAILFDETASRHTGARQMGMRPIEFEIREFTMLIALGNARRRQKRTST